MKQPVAFGPDLFVMLVVGAVIGGTVMVGKQMAAPYHEAIDIDLSLRSLTCETALPDQRHRKLTT